MLLSVPVVYQNLLKWIVTIPMLSLCNDLLGNWRLSINSINMRKIILILAGVFILNTTWGQVNQYDEHKAMEYNSSSFEEILLQMKAKQNRSLNFIQYNISNLGNIKISNAMEIKDQQTSPAPIVYLPYSNYIVFQQKGLNAKNQQALKTYARVIIQTILGETGNFSTCKGFQTKTAEDLDIIDKEIKLQISEVLKKQGANIITWNKCTTQKINGQNVIKCSYSRKYRTNPPTMVHIYFFENNDRVHKINIEYWIQDERFWKPLLEKSLLSFKITEIQ